MPFERELRDLAHVPRWSIARKIKTQSVAEHSFYVAVYADQLAKLCGWYDQPEHSLAGVGLVPPAYPGDLKRYGLVVCALWHDVEESFTGDIPGPFKRQVSGDLMQRVTLREAERRFFEYPRPDFSKTGQEMSAIIRVANILDEYFYLLGEKQMGNRANEAIIGSVDARLKKAWGDLPWSSLEARSAAWDCVQIALAREQGGTSEVWDD